MKCAPSSTLQGELLCCWRFDACRRMPVTVNHPEVTTPHHHVARPHPSHNGSFTDGWYQMAKEGKRPLLEKDSVQHTEFPWPPQLPLQRQDPPKAQGSMDIFMKEDRNFATENRVQLQRKQGRPSTSFKPSDSSVEEVHKQMFLVEPFSYETNMQRSFKQLAFPERETKVPKCKINTLGPAASGGAFWLQKFGNVVSQMKESYSEDSLKANTAPHASESKQASRTAGKFDSQFTTKWDDKLYVGRSAQSRLLRRQTLSSTLNPPLQVLSQQLQGHFHNSCIGS